MLPINTSSKMADFWNLNRGFGSGKFGLDMGELEHSVSENSTQTLIKQENTMSTTTTRKRLNLMGLGIAALMTSATPVLAGVSYSLRADADEAGVYVAYAQSDEAVSMPYSMIGSAQVSIVLPAGSVPQPVGGGEDYKVSDQAESAGTWVGEDVSLDVDSAELNGDEPGTVWQVQLAPTGPNVAFDAGEEIALFRFSMPDGCDGSIRLLDPQSAFATSKPNSRGLASANSWSTMANEQYQANYRQGEAACQ